LVVSDGALQYVPFAALPSPETEGQRDGEKEKRRDGGTVGQRERENLRPNFSQSLRPSVPPSLRPSVPLIVDHEIVSLPSASALAVLRRELARRHPAPKSVAGLAGPLFELAVVPVKTTRALQPTKPPHSHPPPSLPTP